MARGDKKDYKHKLRENKFYQKPHLEHNTKSTGSNYQIARKQKEIAYPNDRNKSRNEHTQYSNAVT